MEDKSSAVCFWGVFVRRRQTWAAAERELTEAFKGLVYLQYGKIITMKH